MSVPSVGPSNTNIEIRDIGIQTLSQKELDDATKVDDIGFKTIKAAAITAVAGGTAFYAARVIQDFSTYGLPEQTENKAYLGLCFVGVALSSYGLIRNLYNAESN